MNIKIGRDRLLLLGYFLGTIILGSLLLFIPVAWNGEGNLRYIDALFTSTSAVCVTGLITVNTADYSRFGQTVIMCLIQMGGLGLITFATLYIALPRRKISIVSRGLISDYTLSEVEYQPKKIISSILGLTLAIEGLGMLVLNMRFGTMGYPFFVSAFHAVSAFCNAGFSTFPDNLESFVLDPLVNFTIMGLITMGGIGFIVMRDIGKVISRERTHLSYHSSIVLKTSAALIIAGTVAILALEYRSALSGMTLGQKIMASMFASVTPRTAGFDTILPNTFNTGSVLVTILLMFIGASPASTGGGIKTTTFFILVMTAFRYRDGADSVDYQGRKISGHTIFKAVGVVVKGICIVLAAVIIIEIAEKARGNPLSMVDVLYEVVSGFGTVGLSLGITPGLGDLSKMILISTMFIGRVGLFAMALPKVGRNIEGYANMPGADLMIG
ncbi:MAG TPA: potassium transporter TrkG [Rectinemataceae bacterium]|nr:potassium transporter TrkG [Rectinemataceae bacterium]